MKKSLNYLLALLLFTGSILLTACGKTGPLYLPDPAPQQDSPQPTQQDK